MMIRRITLAGVKNRKAVQWAAPTSSGPMTVLRFKKLKKTVTDI